jgi:sulfur relay (sulfurtransferase) complex TusBCD TusD component (DsrE family)
MRIVYITSIEARDIRFALVQLLVAQVTSRTLPISSCKRCSKSGPTYPAKALFGIIISAVKQPQAVCYTLAMTKQSRALLIANVLVAAFWLAIFLYTNAVCPHNSCGGSGIIFAPFALLAWLGVLIVLAVDIVATIKYLVVRLKRK